MGMSVFYRQYLKSDHWKKTKAEAEDVGPLSIFVVELFQIVF